MNYNRLGSLTDSLSYYDSVSRGKYHVTMQFANLVAEEGESQLPTPRGQAWFAAINDPTLFGLPVRHPLQRIYANLRIEYRALIIDRDFMVERNGVKGVSLYADYNGTQGLFAEITSENGRCGVAPWDWEGEPGSETDPAAQPLLQVRKFMIDGKPIYWQNWFHHGYGRLTYDDWRDGVPTSVETMYTEGKGRVRQSILIPKESRLGSVAEQTMQASEVTDFYSILLFTPRAEFLEMTRKVYPTIPNVNTRSPFNPYPSKGGSPFESHTLGGGTRSAYGLESYGGYEEDEIKSPIKAELKMGAGGLIIQRIRQDLFGPWIYNPHPAAAIILIPVFKEQAERLFGVHVPSGRSIF